MGINYWEWEGIGLKKIFPLMVYSYLAVAGHVSSEVTSNVDSIVIELIAFDGPQLFAA